MILEVLVLGGTVYAGSRAYQQVKNKGSLTVPRLSWPKGWLQRPPRAVRIQPPPTTATPAVRHANQALVISSTSLGLATASLWLANPALSLASVPLMLYVFAPTFQAAWRTLRQERRINNDVLDATRIALCVVMRYDLIAALNACLQALSQKTFVQAEAEFQDQLSRLFGETQADAWVFTKETELQRPVAQLTAGDVVVVSAGESIPADGLVVYGTAWLDQRFATGDSEPLWTWAGERVAATSVVQSGLLYVQLDQAAVAPLVLTIQETLALTADRKSYFQQMGEQSGKRMAPRSLLIFALSLPLLGPDRAAGFLTTGFGNSLHTLGPYTTRNFLIPAAQHGILIKDAHALEAAILVNTIIFDQRVLLDPVARTSAQATVQALRQRPWLMQGVSPHRFAVYVLVNEGEEATARELMTELGLDDYLTATTATTRADLIKRLAVGGRTVCYVGVDEQDPAVMEQARIAISWRGVNRITTTPAQVVLLDRDLQALVRFFELAANFTVKQGFNLVTPIGFDLLDITTTLFVHLGLFYSVLFNYAGLFLSAANARVPLQARGQGKAPNAATAATLGLLTADAMTGSIEHTTVRDQ